MKDEIHPFSTELHPFSKRSSIFYRTSENVDETSAEFIFNPLNTVEILSEITNFHRISVVFQLFSTEIQLFSTDRKIYCVSLERFISTKSEQNLLFNKLLPL
jgi:hypothetical protein